MTHDERVWERVTAARSIFPPVTSHDRHDVLTFQAGGQAEIAEGWDLGATSGDGVIDSEGAHGKASSNGDAIAADVAPKRVSGSRDFGVGGNVGDSWFDGSSTVAGLHGEWRCGRRSRSLGMAGTETTARPQGAMI